MSRIDMNRKCPTCREQVFGYRKTKRYCGDTCRAKHHFLARKQLEERFEEEEIQKYHQLISRNMYLAEGLIGQKYSKVEINFQKIKMFKFQFSEAFEKVEDEGIEKFKICNYQYWQVGEIVHIERLGMSPQYFRSVEERWLEEFPDYSGRRKLEGAKRHRFKKFLLKNEQVWRE